MCDACTVLKAEAGRQGNQDGISQGTFLAASLEALRQASCASAFIVLGCMSNYERGTEKGGIRYDQEPVHKIEYYFSASWVYKIM